MAKNTKGARILEDQTATQAPQAPAGEETPARKKKNSNVSVVYLNAEKAESKSIPADVIGWRIRVNGLLDKEVLFSDLPDSIKLQMLAFGGNTVYRNEINTTLHTEGKELPDAVEAFETRHQGFLDGQWARTGEGGDGGVPLVIEAIRRFVTEKAGAEKGEAKYNAALEIYRKLGDDKKAKAAQLAAWNTGPVNIMVERIKTEAAQKRLDAAMGKQGSASADDILADL